MDYYHVDNKYCNKEDGGWENWSSMARYVTLNFQFTPLTANNYYYYYNSYDDWTQTADIEVHIRCAKDPWHVEPTTPWYDKSTTPEPTTVPKTTLNFNYVNGLDQEYLIDINCNQHNFSIRLKF